MEAIVSLLDAHTNEKVLDIWDELNQRCGLRAVLASPIPHFTWQAAESYNQPGAKEMLRGIGCNYREFRVRIVGLGIFSGEKPTLYISLVRDRLLTRLHQELWKKIVPWANTPSWYYSPAMWVPHITLAYQDLTEENLPCALKAVAFQSFDWEIVVDNLAILCQNQDGTGALEERIIFNMEKID